MSLPPLSYPLAIGEVAPAFHDLPGIDGHRYSLSSFEDKKVLILVFMANRCPTARVYSERMKEIQRDYGERGVQIVAINSDNPYLFSSETVPEMVKVAKERGYPFPYLKDEDQGVAGSYGAQVTLHAFVLDQDRRIRYRGRIDDSRDPALVTIHDLRNAVDDVLASQEVRVPETRPFACTIEMFKTCATCGGGLIP